MATNKTTAYYRVYPWGREKSPLSITSDSEAKKFFKDERDSSVNNPTFQPIAVIRVTEEAVIELDPVIPEVSTEPVLGIDPTTLGPIPGKPRMADGSGDPTTLVSTIVIPQ